MLSCLKQSMFQAESSKPENRGQGYAGVRLRLLKSLLH